MRPSMLSRRDARAAALKPWRVPWGQRLRRAEGYQMCPSYRTNKISALMLGPEVRHSSQSVVFNSLTGAPLKFKYWMGVDGAEVCA